MTNSHITFENSASDVFDPIKLIRQIEQSQSRAIAVLEIVDRMVSESIHPIEEAQKAFLRNQPHQAAHMLYAIKCSAANFGGLRVVELTEELEDNLDRSHPNPRTIENLFNSLIHEFRSFLLEAESWLKLQRNLLLSRSALQAEKYKAQFKQFKLHLENNNFKAWDVFHDLQDHLKSSLSSEDFLGLGTFIENFEFDKALKCIKSIY